MKYTSRILILILMLCNLTGALYAQERKGREAQREKFRSMKIAYFTEELELTSEEAEKFWPLYNDFENKKREVTHYRHRRPQNMDEQLADMTDQEAEKMADDIIKSRKKEVELAEAFHVDLKKIFPQKKVLKYYITEHGFREYMLRRIRDERRNGNGKKQGNPPPGSLHP